MATESPPPEKSEHLPLYPSSALKASQDEINVRAEWLLQDAGFDKIEQTVCGKPPIGTRLRQFGATIITIIKSYSASS